MADRETSPPIVASAVDESESGRTELDRDEARAMRGARLDAIDAPAAARVEGLLVDATGGEPTWLMIRLGRFGRRSAIPVDLVAPGAGRAWTPHRRDTIRSAPEVSRGEALTVARERDLAAHYGIPAGAGRSAVLADRGDGDPGSVPAA